MTHKEYFTYIYWYEEHNNEGHNIEKCSMWGVDNTHGTSEISEYPWTCRAFEMGLPIACWCFDQVGASPSDLQHTLTYISLGWARDGAIVITPTRSGTELYQVNSMQLPFRRSHVNPIINVFHLWVTWRSFYKETPIISQRMPSGMNTNVNSWVLR